jgi:hypothetical protein
MMHSSVLIAALRARRIAVVGLRLSILASITFPGCYYLKSPKDRTSDSQFDFVRDKCIEIDRRAFLVEGGRNPGQPYDYELRFAENSLLSALEGAPPAKVSEALARRGRRPVRVCEVGTRFRMVRFVETYLGDSPQIITFVKELDGSGPEVSLGEFTFDGFPERSVEPNGGRVVSCDLDPTTPRAQ